MLHSSSFHFRKTKNMLRDQHERKLISRHRFHDFSHMKFTDIFKSLRHRRLRRDIPHRSPLSYSRSFPPPFADHDSSLVQPPSPDLSTSPYLLTPLYRCDAVSILNATEEDCSSGTSTSRSSLDGTPPDVERGLHFSQGPAPTFPMFPSVFQLRSASTEDYLVERLEQDLRRLNLQDALPENPPRDIPMDVCLGSPNLDVSSQSPSCRVPADRDGQEPTSSPHDQNVVPMIVITSVDAKHAKPLPPSDQRPSRTPFGPSNFINHPTNVPSAKSKLKTLPDDPFTTQPHGFAYPTNYHLTFRIPSFPPTYSSPAQYVPETPTPMCCDHFGDCRGDLWEILHPPLVAGGFTLPPFELPPLSAGLFDDIATPLPD